MSLIWSDGDNVQFDSNQMYNMFKNAPGRGKVPVGMTMAASLQELNPVLLEYFYKNLTPNDELVAGPSGFQFIYGDKYNENNYEKWLETNQKWLETAGFHTACLWNTTNKERFGRYMQTCGLQGVLMVLKIIRNVMRLVKTAKVLSVFYKELIVGKREMCIKI